MSTSDLCDENEDAVVFPLALSIYGKIRQIDGTVETAKVDTSNQLLRSILGSPGQGRILLVAGGGSSETVALVGDQLAQLAINNNWQGIVVDGLVRDIDTLAGMEIAVWARGTWPRRGPREGSGERGIPLKFGKVIVAPGDRIVGDADGLIMIPASPGGIKV